MNLKRINIDEHTSRIYGQELCSQLGFFSKPYRIKIDGTELIVKRYHPIRKGAERIIYLHDEYVEVLRQTGLSIPDTRIIVKQRNSRNELMIFQKAVFPGL